MGITRVPLQRPEKSDIGSAWYTERMRTVEDKTHVQVSQLEMLLAELKSKRKNETSFK
jgi:hypothetical protein